MQLERTASRVSLLEVKRRIVRVQPTCRWTFIDLIRLRDACMLEYFLETIYHLGRSWRAPGLLYAIASTQKQPTSLRSHKKHRWERSFSTEDHRRRTRLVAFSIFFFFLLQESSFKIRWSSINFTLIKFSLYLVLERNRCFSIDFNICWASLVGC